jgi:hypothetical protein
MEIVLNALKSEGDKFGANKLIAWYFYVEYFRNILKAESFAPEKEYRFVVSDNYALFLEICSVLSRWGIFITNNKEELSGRFHEEYMTRKLNMEKMLNLGLDDRKKYLQVPLYDVLDSITIGSKSSLSKSEISSVSNYKIRKSQIVKAC